jgi:predicted GH43/DUF377 family glycosyl hydrolase
MDSGTLLLNREGGSMLYRPPEPRSLWGFWIIEWQGACHIFYDEDIDADYNLLSWQKNHDHIGHAVSEDLIHWDHLPSICAKGAPGEWNDMAQGGGVKTGCIVRHEDRFYLFAGAAKDGVQVIGLWLSEDLVEWHQHPENPILRPAGPYYLDAPMKDRSMVGWRDPGILYSREDGCYHIVLCAQLSDKDSQHYLGTTIGHVRSKDLVNWEYLPPVETPDLADRFYQIEEPEIIQIENRYYLVFDGGTTGGMRTCTPDREDVRGSFYMVGHNLTGPFTRPADDLLVGNDLGKRCATTGRVIRWKDELVYVHFSISRRSSLSAVKRVRVREDGTLYLKYMPEMEMLETAVLYRSIGDLPSTESPDLGEWIMTDGRLSGDVKLAGSVYRISDEISDFHLSCCIHASSAARVGFVLRICKHGDSGVWPRGICVILDFERRRIFIGDARSYPSTGWYCLPSEICGKSLSRDRNFRLRILVRDEHLEVYLDDCWVFTSIIPEASKAGAVELMIERGKAEFSEFRLATIKPLA